MTFGFAPFGSYRTRDEQKKRDAQERQFDANQKRQERMERFREAASPLIEAAHESVRQTRLSVFGSRAQPMLDRARAEIEDTDRRAESLRKFRLGADGLLARAREELQPRPGPAPPSRAPGVATATPTPTGTPLRERLRASVDPERYPALAQALRPEETAGQAALRRGSSVLFANPTQIPGVSEQVERLPKGPREAAKVALTSLNPTAIATAPFFGGTAGLRGAATVLGKGIVGASLAGGAAELADAPPLVRTAAEVAGGAGGVIAGKRIATVLGRGLTPEQQAIREAALGPGTFAPDMGTGIEQTGIPGRIGPIEEVATGLDQKMAAAITESRQNVQATQTLRAGQHAERSATYEAILSRELEAGTPYAEAHKLASGARAGAFEVQPGVQVALTPQESRDFTLRLLSNEFKGYERANIGDAMKKLAEGKPITDYYINLLGRMFPETAKVLRTAATQRSGVGAALFDLAVTPKAILSAFDLSYPLRQGIMLAPGHPGEFTASFAPMVRSFRSEEVSRLVYAGIVDDPRTLSLVTANGATVTRGVGQVKADYGLLRTLGGAGEQAEEAFRSTLIERVPGLRNIVRASNRAFVTFGNKFRSDTFDTIVANWQRDGVPLTETRLKDLSNMLNRFTGRGTLADSRVTQLLQATWWAPQYRVSGPEAIAQVFHRDPAIRKEAARNLVAFVGTGLALGTAAKLSGIADVQLDPRSTDFGKMRVGPTRFNYWGTQQLLARTVAQMFAGTAIGLTQGKYVGIRGQRLDTHLGVLPADSFKIAQRYFESGLAPEWSLIRDVMKGENYGGQSLEWDLPTLKREAQERLIPLAMQDIKEAVEEAVRNPSPQSIAVAAAGAPVAILGGTEQTYQESTKSQLNGIPEYEGLTNRQVMDMRDLVERTQAARDVQVQKYGSAHPLKDAIAIMAQKEGQSPNWAGWAYALAAGRLERRPEYLQFLVDHVGDLKERYPYLYDSNDVLKALNKAGIRD